MKRFSHRVWIAVGALAVILAVGIWFTLHGLREPQPLRTRLDLADRGAAMTNVTVYYLAADSLALMAQDRYVLADDTRRRVAEDLVEYLAEAPAELGAPLPAGTRLLHFFEDGRGEAVIDFNSRFEEIEAAGIREERLKLTALVRTLAENLDGVKRVRILVHGRPLNRWGEHLEPGPVLEVEAW